MRRKSLLLLAAAALLTGGCGELLEPAAAVVREHKITVNEIDAALDDFEVSAEFQRLASQNDANVIRRQFEQGYLAVLIRREVLRERADELGVEVTDADIDEQVQAIEDEFESASAFQEAMEERGLTIDLLRERILDREYEEQLRERVIEEVGAPEDVLRAEYEARINEYEQLSASHILFNKADKVIAQSIADALQAAPKKELPALFKDLSSQYSTDKVAKAKGGKLGTFLPHEFSREFIQAAQRLSVGEVSDPVRTEFGWHVIYLTGRDVLSFEEAREDFEDELTAQAQDDVWKEWLLDVYREADIKVNPRYGEFDVETQQIANPSAGDVPGTEAPNQQAPEPAPQPSQPG